MSEENRTDGELWAQKSPRGEGWEIIFQLNLVTLFFQLMPKPFGRVH